MFDRSKSVTELSFLICFIISLLIPSISLADRNYTFIKVTCDPPSKTMKVKTFVNWNDTGEARTLRHEKDIYYLNKISKEPKKTVRCGLGKGQIISFTAWHNEEHMANDNLEFSFNDRSIPLTVFFNMLGNEVETSISVLGPHEVSTRICSSFSNNKANNNKCQTRQMIIEDRSEKQ